MSIRTNIRSLALLLFVFAGSVNGLRAQCPPNIDFEEGTFNHWECFYQTNFAGTGTFAWTPTLPIPGRHDMYTNPPGNGNDLYGNFPINCPNGSGHSIKIGADQNGGHSAAKVSYVFTIPAGQNNYSLIYHYAIVLNDANHPAAQQPRLLIEVTNITDGTPLPCPMAPIVAGSNLPGFQNSPLTANGQPVRFKPWAASSVKLDNLAGKTIEVAFTTTGCGLNPTGTHFGYAYIDINSECSSVFTGATYCPDDAFINVTGPYGYQNYSWWDPTYTINYGNTQT
ncbi:MAG TPA: hypothetical protein PKG65_16470, partial [Ferruginibacter sp.]|nr:hypothetical protein [Ferruginibacter sp.]